MTPFPSHFEPVQDNRRTEQRLPYDYQGRLAFFEAVFRAAGIRASILAKPIHGGDHHV